MNCWIYRSPKKDEMYLYLAKEDDFDAVPEELLKRFGTPAQIMELELTPERKLAREDVEKVKANLAEKAFTYRCHRPLCRIYITGMKTDESFAFCIATQ